MLREGEVLKVLLMKGQAGDGGHTVLMMAGGVMLDTAVIHVYLVQMIEFK